MSDSSFMTARGSQSPEFQRVRRNLRKVNIYTTRHNISELLNVRNMLKKRASGSRRSSSSSSRHRPEHEFMTVRRNLKKVGVGRK